MPDATLALVELAVSSDEPEPLIAAAADALHRPLALADRSGAVLARAPGDAAGEQAASVARAATRTSLMAPPGWSIVPLARHRVALGVLAIGENGDGGGRAPGLLRLLPALLVDQLRRRSLLNLQRAAFARRLISTPAPPPHAARRDAAELGIELDTAYWVAVLGWRRGRLRREEAMVVEQAAASATGSALTARLEDELILLHPADGDGDDRRAAAWFEQAAVRARELAPASSAQAVAAEEPIPLERLGAEAAHLVHLARLGSQAVAGRPLTWSHEHALDELLAGRLDRASGERFVEAHLGPVLAWDREHHTDLLTVLEASLDEPQHTRAAARCFMHRNTFRHRLGQATDLLGRRLDAPEGRLAVRLAIKLHRTGLSPAQR
ncbi:MAG TPA: helix-turn-helix domain-containing protein [Capillimicrobium sp.]|nr:helix-turn-helix domain-containing protein [Capillimicrobium sp.]